MKNFLRKIFLIVVITLGLSLAVKVLLPLPYYWGNPWFKAKIEFLGNNSIDELPNTFFFGSSRVYRQIDPSIYDNTFSNLSEHPVRSFNLGAPATFCPQTYYLFENFIDTKEASNAKFIFMELMDIDLINKDLLHQDRTIYWQNHSDFFFVLNSVYTNDNVSFIRKIGYTYRYGISVIENAFNVGFYCHIIVKKDLNREEYLGKNKNGYYPLQEELSFSTEQTIKENLMLRESSLTDDTISLAINRAFSIQNFTAANIGVDQVHLERIRKLIQMSDNLDIELIFIISPRTSSPGLVALYNSIDPQHKLELSNASVYPQLYLMENTFDIDHLNTQGSELYTKILARQVMTKFTSDFQ